MKASVTRRRRGMSRPAVTAGLAMGIGEGSDVVTGSLISVCSKRVRDWERCL